MRKLEYCLLACGVLVVMTLLSGAALTASAQEPTPTPTPTVAPYIQTYTVNGQEVVVKYLVEAGDYAVVTVLSLLLFVNVLMLIVMLRKPAR
jgi:hypothetical protein